MKSHVVQLASSLKPTIIVAAVATAAVLAPAVAFAAFSVATSNPGNAVGAGVLSAPGDLTATAHPVDSAANSGAVTLTWTDTRAGSGTVNPAGYVVQRRPAGAGDWTTVATPARASVCDAGGTCVYTDATAGFNAAYGYRIQSTVANWTAGPTDVRVAASIAPSAAEGRGTITAGLTSVAQYGSGLIAVGPGGRVVVCSSSCTGAGVTWSAATSPTTNDLNRVVVDSSGVAWAVGDAGTVLKCASLCVTTGSWTHVATTTTANLYGIFTTSGYMAVVGADRTMLYATNNNGTGWQTASVNGGIATTTTFYGVTGKSSKDVVVVGGTGSAGVVAACPNGGGVCGGSLTLTAVTSYSGGAPANDLRDVGYVGGGGDNVYAVGLGGQVYVSTSTLPTGTYTKKSAGTTADLYVVVATSQSSAAAAGAPASGNSAFLRCTSNCAGSGTWSAGADTGTTNHLRGLAGTGTAYWAVGAAGTIRYFAGGSWSAQNPPSQIVTIAPAVVSTHDGDRATVAAGPLSATCAGPALVVTASVPARSGAGVTTPTVRVTVSYSFAGATNAGQVLVSTNGTTWSTARALTSNVSTSTVRTVDLTGTVAAGDSAQDVQVCVQGSGVGPMFVDMVHLDVEE